MVKNWHASILKERCKRRNDGKIEEVSEFFVRYRKLT